jgi:hypothetical protein
MALLSLFSKILLSILLWPLAFCMAAALGQSLWALPWKDPRLLSFGAGALSYGLIQAFFWRPLFVYVMGHELTHALASLLQGGKADDMRISTKGGMVKVEVSNFLTSLAPYFFPIYTFFLLVIYWIADPRYRIYLVFLLGVSLAFHWALTAYSLKQHQSDIAESGWLFALPFIGALNLFILVFVLHSVIPEGLSLKNYADLSLQSALGLYHWTRSIL